MDSLYEEGRPRHAVVRRGQGSLLVRLDLGNSGSRRLYGKTRWHQSLAATSKHGGVVRCSVDEVALFMVLTRAPQYPRFSIVLTAVDGKRDRRHVSGANS